VSAYAALSSEARALVSLVTSVLTAVATIFFAWLQSQLKALGEGTRRNEDATGRKIEEASRRSEEAAKETARRSEAIMDLIRNEHRKSMQDSKLSNYFVVIVAALCFLIPRLRS